jgi:hypothetical protein
VTMTTQAEDRDATGGTRLDREQTATTTLSLDNGTKVATQGHTGPTASSIGLADSVQVREEPRTITLLPKLNLKLRLKIWNSALSGPRYIEVLNKPYLHPTGASPSHSHYICACLAPALFFVNHESRASLYSPLYSTVPGSPTIYYNAAFDVLCLRYVREDTCYEFRGRSSRLLPRRRTR